MGIKQKAYLRCFKVVIVMFRTENILKIVITLKIIDIVSLSNSVML